MTCGSSSRLLGKPKGGRPPACGGDLASSPQDSSSPVKTSVVRACFFYSCSNCLLSMPVLPIGRHSMTSPVVVCREFKLRGPRDSFENARKPVVLRRDR